MSSIILWSLLFAILGAAIGLAKDRVGTCICLCLLLGPFGVILACFVTNERKKRAASAADNQARAMLRQANAIRTQSRNPQPDYE